MKPSMLASALLLLMLCGCGSRTPPAGERRFGGKGAGDQGDKAAEPLPMYVELPKGWEERGGRGRGFGGGGGGGRPSADIPSLDAHFRLDFQPQTEFDGDLLAWAKARKQATAEQSTLANRQETELATTQVAGHDVVEYEITGEVAGVPGRTRVFFLSVGTWFCKLTCWTTPANWATAQPKFEELVGRIRLGPPPVAKTAEPAPKTAEPAPKTAEPAAKTAEPAAKTPVPAAGSK